jgi:arylsulfatase A-like enzyme
MGVLESALLHLPLLLRAQGELSLILPVLSSLCYGVIGAALSLVRPWLAAPGLWIVACAALWRIDATRAALAMLAAGLGWLGARYSRAGIAAVVLLILALLIPRGDEPVASGTPERPDVVVVVMDTVAAERTSLHGFELETTPFLAELAREGAWFRAAVAPSPWTVPSHCSLFTGRSPRELGCHHEHLALLDEVPTTAELLEAAGYRTGAFIANPWVSKETGLVRGFEKVLLADDVASANAELALLHFVQSDPPREKSGRSLVHRTLGWLERGGATPSYAFLNLLEAHSPYHWLQEPGRFGVTDPVRTGDRSHRAIMQGPQAVGYPEPGEEGEAEALHAAGIRAVDELLRTLVDTLRERGQLDRTLIVITSDHGESFGAHGYHGHLIDLYEELTHVPLVVRFPELFPPGTQVDSVVSLEQIHPTILQVAMGQEQQNTLLEPPGVAISEHFRPLILFARDHWGEGKGSRWDRRAVRVRSGDRALLRTMQGDGTGVTEAAFDLVNDPAETRGLTPDETVAELRVRLDAHLAVPDRAAAASGALEMSPELEKRLESLGYLR